MSYQETVEGIKVTSNQPFTYDAPAGTLVTIDLHWIYPIAFLEQAGYDLQHLLGQQSFIDQLVRQGVPASELPDNYSVYTVDQYTTRVAFVSKGIGQLVIIAAIIAGAIVVVVFGAVALSYMSLQFAQTPAGGIVYGGLGVLEISLGVAAVAGVAILGYGFVKSREVRAETLKTTAAGIRFAREQVVPAVGKLARGAAPLAQRGVAYARAQLARPAESEEP